MMSNNKNVTKFHVLLWKIIVTSAKDSSVLCIIDKIMVSLMCTLELYTYVSICMYPWSYYGLCQCLLEELGIYGIQNSSVHQDLVILIFLLLDCFLPPSHYSSVVILSLSVLLLYSYDRVFSPFPQSDLSLLLLSPSENHWWGHHGCVWSWWLFPAQSGHR